MEKINFNENTEITLETLSKGAFLTTKYGDKANTMTIAWGSIGFIWGKPIFMAMVRHSRYTYELIEKSNEFTVSIPLNDMKAALGLCGTKSGRDMDKISAAGLTLAPGQVINTPIIENAGQHYECKVLFKQCMSDQDLNEDVKNRWYADNDYHTMYFGEIVAAYQD